MATYSNSRLWLFENCPEAYKIKYIDKTFPDLPKSVEAFLGTAVHSSLEWLYNEVKNRVIELDPLIEYYANVWASELTNLRITNGKKEDYFNKGIKFLIDYYLKNTPFEENTLDIEKEILFDLDDKAEHKILGYIDRLVLNKNGEYEVHDYKTNSFMKKQEDVDKDRQLAFYHMGLKKIYGEDIKVKLIWHFLAHNKSIISTRTDEQLKKLKSETIELIKKIESTTIWPACGRNFCDWCSYKKNSNQNTKLSFLTSKSY